MEQANFIKINPADNVVALLCVIVIDCNSITQKSRKVFK